MKIAVIGAGNMGMAFSSAFVRKGLIMASDLLLIEPRIEAHEHLKSQGFDWILSAVSAEIEKCDLIILAVKPQDFPTLASQLREYTNHSQIILSIMAGIGIDSILKSLKTTKVVRCMPNTPTKLGVGITGFYCQNLNHIETNLVKTLLECTGKAIVLKEEGLLNAVTAISGSGPAYFYYFLRAMVQAGEQLGMTHEMAKELACETMLGSYHLVKDSNVSFDELIKAVASKGGTTEAALSTFDEFLVSDSIEKGLLNAEKRAWQLSQTGLNTQSK
jgi:pyrroline-5-carboxylate reductase